MEDAKNQDQKPTDEVNAEDEEEEESEEELEPGVADNELLEACKNGNLEQVNYWLDKKADPLFSKGGWSPLLWAACNGDEEIVRVLIRRDAAAPYLKVKAGATNQDVETEEAKKKAPEDEEEVDPFIKPQDARKVGKYTPLHWASYKGFYKIVWFLLKIGMSPLDIDMYGNSSVHQAAASGNLKVLQCYLSRGVDVDMQNARGHSPLDLTTEPETKALILKATKTKACETCKSKFDFKNIRYYCESSRKFFCKDCSTTTWVYEHHEAEDKERPVCRSKAVAKLISDHEKELAQAIETINPDDFEIVDKALRKCDGIDIDVKLRHRADILHLKLFHELKIKTFLEQNNHHDDYKEIRKDEKRINEMVEEAQNLDVDLDPDLLVMVNEYCSRIITERNLRKQRDLFLDSIHSWDDSKVSRLQHLTDIAVQNQVEPQYIEHAQKLTGQMSGNIQAHNSLKMLTDYPQREYPEVEVIDPKKKQDKKKEKKKGKKKKEPAFNTPEWATTLQAVIDKVKQIEQFTANKEDLKLDAEFCEEVDRQLKRFKKEITFRKQQEEEARIEAELKALKKKKKKK